MNGDDDGGGVGGNRPVPDPTVLTTEALQRGLQSERDHTDALGRRLEAAIAAVRSLFETQDSAAAQLAVERVRSMEEHFRLVETQRVEQKVDTKSAVDAALIAQKEAYREQTTASERAVAKSDAATTKQIEQLTLTFRAGLDGLTTLLGDTKDRVGVIEATRQGGIEQHSQQQSGIGATVSVLGLVVAVVSVAALVISVFLR